ncbi:unnamed protein product [Closterium sp. NIES-64]|nr:unnamed protein product [Closterium sp. NIES-64]
MAPGDLSNRDADPSLPAVAAESRSSVRTETVDETRVTEGLRLRKLRLGRDDQKRQTLHVPKAHVHSTDPASLSSLQATPEPVSPVGRLFLDNGFYTTILCVLEFKNEMEIKELRDILEHTLLQHPRFHSRLVSSPGGVPAWVLMDAADVDLEYHVVEEEAADVDSSQRHIHEYLAVLLWVADTPTPIKGGPHLHCHAPCVLHVCFPLPFTPSLPIQILEYLAVLLWVADTPTPIKGGPHLHCHALPRCFAVSPEMSLEDVSAIRKAVKGATVNDVMLTVISGGIERYLALVGSDTTNGGSPLPHRLRVSALALFNLRPAPGLQELSELMAGQRSQARWGNHLGNILLPLPIYSRAQGRNYRPSQQSDSNKPSCRAGEGEREGKVTREEVERLGAVRALCASRKDSLMAHWTYLNGRLLMPLVGCKPVAVLTRRSLDHTTLSLSNVVGPLEEVALHGHPISAIIPSVYGSNHALTCHIQTYKGAARVVVSAVKQHVSNPHLLCRCFFEAFQQLKEEAKTIV